MKTGPFHYTRLESWSEHLKRSVPCGILSLSENSGEFNESVYLFHGGNGDDQQFVQAQLAEMIDESNLKKLCARNVRIILPYIGVSFLHGRVSDYFFSELLPHLEGDLARPRHIGGWSMGGFAALSAFFRFPELFQSVGAHFPTLVDFDFLSAVEIQKFSARTRLATEQLEVILDEFKREFPERSDFKEFNPIDLAHSINPSLLASKPLFFDVGSEDEFGLYEGAQKLAKILSEKKIAHSHTLVQGGHHDAAFLHSRLNFLFHSALSMS